MTADLCPTKSVSIMFGHRNRNSGRLARRSPKALKAPSFSRPAQMLEDGLAIAELVKREERNAKRRAKRGSAPKATADLLQIIKRLEEIGAGFLSLTEAIDTTTPVGRMLTQVLGSFAEFEREMIRERTKLGLARARLEGRVGGNRASLTPKQQAHALAMIDEGKSQSEVAEVFRVHRSTICRLVAERRVLERA